MKRTMIVGAVLAGLACLSGCSATSAAMTGIGFAKNSASNRLDVRLYLDGVEAERNELKQAVTGYSRWKVKGDVTTTPTLKFDSKKPDALGRIRSVIVSIHQKHEAKYSDQAEFTIVSRSNAPEEQMKPGVVYDLGAPGSNFKVMNWKGEEVSGVQLRAGWQYMLTFTVSADDSESAQIFFEAKKE